MIRLQDYFSGPLARAQAAYQKFGSGFDQVTRRITGLFKKTSLSVDELKAKLAGLEKKRSIMVDTREIAKATREIEKTKKQLADLQKQAGQKPRGADGRFLPGYGGGGKGGGGVSGYFRDALPYITAGALVAGAGSAFTSGMNREQVGLQLEQFLKTPEATNMMLTQLNRFADVTPYSNQEVYQSCRSMLAARIAPEQLMSKMQNVGNMAAASGKSFNDLSQAYSKIKMKDFIDGGELHMEFGGTLLMEQLQKNLKVTGEQLFKMAEKRLIRFADVDKAISDLTGNGGDYAGALDKLANSAGGKLSTFLGTFGNKIAEWTATQNSKLGKLFDFGSEFLTKMKPIEEAFVGLIDAFSPLWETLQKLGVAFGLISQDGSQVDIVVSLLTNSLKGLTIIVSGLTSPLGQLYIAGAAVYMLLLKMPLILNAVTVAFSSNPVTVWLVALGALVIGLKWAYDNLEWFRKGVDTVTTFLIESFRNIGVILEAIFFPGPKTFAAAMAAIGSAWNKTGSATRQQAGDSSGDRAAYENERDDRSLQQKRGRNALGKPGGAASGGGGSLGNAGLQSAVSGAKSTSVTINLKSLVEGGLHIHSMNLSEGADEIERIMVDRLLRVVNSANAVAL